MQKTHDESDQGTGAAATGGPEGLGQHTYRIEFRAQGTEGALARATQFGMTNQEVTAHPKGNVLWLKYCFDNLVFSQMTACSVLQGADLRSIFSARSYCVLQHTHETAHLRVEDAFVLDHGPFYLLQGVLSQVYDPPLRLKKAIMARLGARPQGLSDIELVTFLIMTVCPP